MDYGHYKISRKTNDDPFWNEPRIFSKWEAWEYVIRHTAYANHRKPFAHDFIELERGQFVASLRYLAKKWQWGLKRVRNFLGLLERMGRIRAHKRTQQGTVYVVVNYDLYQGTPRGKGTRTVGRGAHRGHTGGTIEKQGKQEKKGNSESNDELIVLEHYRAAHPRRKVGDAKQVRVVRAALKLGFSIEQLCRAITGNAHDPWHKERRKHELSYVLRDADHINQALAHDAVVEAPAFPGYPDV